MSNTIELSGIFSEGYGFVPKKLMKAKDIKSNTKLILCYLLSYTGAGVECFPSMDGIASNLNLSKRTIIRCLHEAIDNGYLNKTQGELSDKRANKYYLNFMADLGAKKSSKEGDKKTPKPKEGDCESPSLDLGDKKTPNKVTPGNSNSNSKSNNNKSSTKKPIFKKPTLLQVKEFFTKHNFSSSAEDLYYHYEANGWTQGKAGRKLVSWEAAAQGWERRAKKWVNEKKPDPSARPQY